MILKDHSKFSLYFIVNNPDFRKEKRLDGYKSYGIMSQKPFGGLMVMASG